MEVMKEFGGVGLIPPLQKGNSFLCYRDVNKAIEKHRELYGLRLALKRAVKLENYHLTVDQLKDLNLRLKYGELDYHCFAATGRPGRPGNDERCPQLIRLKLSPDAHSLIVYESHNHNILPSCESTQKSQQPAVKQTKLDFFPLPSDRPCFRGDITLTPINPVQKNPVLILPKPVPGVTTVPGIVGIDSKPQTQVSATSPFSFTKNFFINNNSFGTLTPVTEMNSITITPTNNPNPSPPVQIYPLQESDKGGSGQSSDGDSKIEKITMRIKKSQVVPNEMVIVGSLRDTVEQLHSKGHVTNPAPSSHSLDTAAPKITNSIGTNSKESSPKPFPQPLKVSKERMEHLSHTTINLAGNSMPKTVSNNGLKAINPKTNPKINNNDNSNPTTAGESPGLTSRKSLIVNPKPGGVALPPKPISPSGIQSSKLPVSQSQKDGFRPKSKLVTSTGSPSPASTSTSSPLPSYPSSFSSVTENAITAKPTVLKQSPNMKQIIVKKSPQVEHNNKPKSLNVNKTLPSGINKQSSTGVNKPVKYETTNNKTPSTCNNIKSQTLSVPKPNVTKTNTGYKPMGNKNIGNNAPNPENRRTIQKPLQNSKVTSNSAKYVSSSHQPNNQTTKRLSNGTVSDRARLKGAEKPHPNASERILRNVVDSSSCFYSSYSVVNGNMNGGNRSFSIPKKLKRKPGRPPDSSYNSNANPLSLDTELGYSEKQQLAHGVLLQLLKVTSQLPMVEFSHALDTLEVVTDAFRLGQRVSLTIRHDQEDLVCPKEEDDVEDDSYFNETFKEEKENFKEAEEDAEVVTSTTTTVEDLHRRQQRTLVSTQVDGAFTVDDLLLKGMSTGQNSALPQPGDENHLRMHHPQVPPLLQVPQEPFVEVMEVVPHPPPPPPHHHHHNHPEDGQEDLPSQRHVSNYSRTNKRPALSLESRSKRRKLK